ncbi:MAG: urease accessory protein UreH domain-containing protein [Promethearchaeota archaeon]
MVLLQQMLPLNFFLVFLPGISVGIFHTLIPCEDKTIFAFYALGVSRDTKEALKILLVYSIGLFFTNMVIGAIMAFIGFLLGNIVFQDMELFFNGAGAISIMISGTYLLIQVLRKKHNPHSNQDLEIADTFQDREGRFKKRTGFLLGVLAGIPPCVYETYIYTQAVSFSASYGFINGVAVVFFFGIGSLLGLIPLSLFGLVGSYARKKMKNLEITDEKRNIHLSISKIELISSILLILLGIILLSLALSGIHIFPPPEVPPL